MSLQKASALRDERASVIEKMQAASAKAEAEGRDLNDEERASWDAMDAEQGELLKRAKRLETEHDMAKSLEEKAYVKREAGREDRGDTDKAADPKEQAAREKEAFGLFMRFGMEALNQEQRTVMASLQANVTPEMRAQSTSTTAGGYLIPEGFQAELEQALLDFGGMREAARILRTATGNDLPWPEVNDTTNEGALLAENTQDGEQDFTFGVTTFNAYMYTSKIVRVSLQLLQDSAFDVDAFMRDALGVRLGRITNRHMTTGTGSSQPNGVVTASTAGVTAASSSTVTHDELLDLKHSVDPAYRRMPSTRWMFNDGTLKVLKKLKDSDNRPLWAPGISVREPDVIDGDVYTVNQAMPVMGSSTKSILYGDFSKYVIRDVRDASLLRLVERYADYLQVGFLAFMRSDGDLVDAGTNPIKHLVHPSP